jgi:hypothetical protein
MTWHFNGSVLPTILPAPAAVSVGDHLVCWYARDVEHGGAVNDVPTVCIRFFTCIDYIYGVMVTQYYWSLPVVQSSSPHSP